MHEPMKAMRSTMRGAIRGPGYERILASTALALILALPLAAYGLETIKQDNIKQDSNKRSSSKQNANTQDASKLAVLRRAACRGTNGNARAREPHHAGDGSAARARRRIRRGRPGRADPATRSRGLARSRRSRVCGEGARHSCGQGRQAIRQQEGARLRRGVLSDPQLPAALARPGRRDRARQGGRCASEKRRRRWA